MTQTPPLAPADRSAPVRRPRASVRRMGTASAAVRRSVPDAAASSALGPDAAHAPRRRYLRLRRGCGHEQLLSGVVVERGAVVGVLRRRKSQRQQSRPPASPRRPPRRASTPARPPAPSACAASATRAARLPMAASSSASEPASAATTSMPVICGPSACVIGSRGNSIRFCSASATPTSVSRAANSSSGRTIQRGRRTRANRPSLPEILSLDRRILSLA